VRRYRATRPCDVVAQFGTHIPYRRSRREPSDARSKPMRVDGRVGRRAGGGGEPPRWALPLMRKRIKSGNNGSERIQQVLVVVNEVGVRTNGASV